MTTTTDIVRKGIYADPAYRGGATLIYRPATVADDPDADRFVQSVVLRHDSGRQERREPVTITRHASHWDALMSLPPHVVAQTWDYRFAEDYWITPDTVTGGTWIIIDHPAAGE